MRQSVKHSCCDIIQQKSSNNWLTGDRVSSLCQPVLGLHAPQKLTGSWRSRAVKPGNLCSLLSPCYCQQLVLNDLRLPGWPCILNTHKYLACSKSNLCLRILLGQEYRDLVRNTIRTSKTCREQPGTQRGHAVLVETSPYIIPGAMLW